jgi:hypothetical protein
VKVLYHLEENISFVSSRRHLMNLNRHQQFGTRKIDQFIKDFDFNHGEFDHNLYFRIGFDRNMVIILLYVDNFLIVVDYKGEIERIRRKLMKAFEMTNLGRIKLHRDRMGGFFEFNMLDCKLARCKCIHI